MNFKAYIEKWIIPHRRGIMGTVIFHLVLAIFLLSMEISRIQVHTEMEIVMDTPTPEERQKKEEEQQRKEEIRQKTSQEEVERMLRSIAVNENAVQPEKRADASVQQYVDEILKKKEIADVIKPNAIKITKKTVCKMIAINGNRNWIL